ncbi:MAG: peptide-methionine (S)-S-oxide reductase MsrA [Defluviitaleaceae bacterium]|nr:peptide-methionine (S)-S-oxide reductase MsrA [Defluviitaleaceae bacterium]
MLPYNKNLDLIFKAENLKTIYLAGGCFWGTDAYMARVHGVAETESGYANGHALLPVTYEGVCTETTGYAETVKVVYDETRVNLTHLLDEFFSITNPTTLNKQANDIGTRYRSGIYYVDEADVPVIEAVIANVQKSYDQPVVTTVEPLTSYQPAEAYHQNYLEKNPNGYCHVKFN